MAGWELAPISWEALATLATGGAAVGAAWVVGRNQIKLAREQLLIASRQGLVLERQVVLEELKLRSELFPRRFAVYEATVKFLAAIMTHGDEPMQAIQQEFLVAIDQARFLYRPEVYDQLQEIWQRACGLFAATSMMKAQYERTGDYGKGNIDQKYEAMSWINAKLLGLSDLFGDELQLGATSAPEAMRP